MTVNYKESAIALVSGGLDSLVSLLECISLGMDVKVGLTFNYGQRAADAEIEAARALCRAYNISHRVIDIPFLGEISSSRLNKGGALEFSELGTESAKAVWVPNRNGLFLNIAASFCDGMGLNYIIFGANREEAATFSDNSEDFIKGINNSFEYSTNVKCKVIAPLSGLMKFEIINLGVKLGADFKLVKSCYEAGGGKHCGVCESCRRLKDGILKSKHKDLIKLFF